MAGNDTFTVLLLHMNGTDESPVDLTVPGGSILADSEFDTSHQASQAINNSSSATFPWSSTNTAFPHWIRYDFGLGQEKPINRYTLRARSDFSFPNRLPRDFELQGSNNDVDWTTLDIRSGIVFSSGERKTFDDFSEGINKTAYRYYRIFVTANNGDADWCQIEELELIETFIDDSSSAHIITENGDAQIDTAESKFGGAAGLFDGNGDYLSIPDDDASFDFGSGDWTIDFWAKKASLNATTHLVGQWEAGNNKMLSTRITNANIFDLEYRTSGGSNFIVSSTFTLSDTNWHHYAIVRDGNTLRFFVDGNAEGTDDWTGITLNNASRDFLISSFSDGSQAMNGWLDEVRVSKGIARWTSPFTPPTEEYTSSTEVLSDINTDIRAKHTETIIDLNTDIRAAKEELIDVNTDIRVKHTEVLSDISTDIRLQKEILSDINTDIRAKHTLVLSDIDTDIRVAKEELKDINTDIRVAEDVLKDINTDIRTRVGVFKDVNTDIRIVNQNIEDISTDIRVRTDANSTQIVVNNLFFNQGFYLSNNIVDISLDVSGATKMQFRNEDSSTWSTLETYSEEKLNWNLSSGDGEKTVFVRFEDILGNLSNGQHSITAIVNTSTPPAVNIEGYEDETLAATLAESFYQEEDTPFFRWQIPTFNIPYIGFSIGINEAPNDEIDVSTPDIVQSGIIPSIKVGLPERTIETTSGIYYFSRDLKDYSSQEITLDVGGSQDRIDVIYISGTTESLNFIKGIESTSPVKPSIPQDGIELAEVLVPAGATLSSELTLTDTRELFINFDKLSDEPLGTGQHTFEVKGVLDNGEFSDIDTFNLWVANPSPNMGDISGFTDGTLTTQIFNGLYQTSSNTPTLTWSAAPAEPGPINYHYTTDGSEPTLASPFTTATSLSLGPFSDGITTIKIKPFDSTTGNSGDIKEFILVFGTLTFTNDTAVIGNGTTLKQSLKEVHVRNISFNFDSARLCVFEMPSKLFDDNLPFNEGDTVVVVHGAGNTTVFRGKIKQLERTINISEEIVRFHAVGPRGDLNECYFHKKDPDLGDTAQVIYENASITDVINDIVNVSPNIITSVESFPTGANVSDEFIAQTLSQVLDSVYSRTKFDWFLEPDGTLVSVNASVDNPGEAKFGVFGTTVNSISPQYNVMSNNLTFDVNKRYTKAIIEGARKRERISVRANCGTSSLLKTLVDDGTRASELKYKVFEMDSKWPVVKIIKTFVSYARLNKFVLVPLGDGLTGPTKFVIFFLETEVCRSNNIIRTKRETLAQQSAGGSFSPPELRGVAAAFTGIKIDSIEEDEEAQGFLGPNNTIRFSRAMYSFWPSGVSHNSEQITVTPGINILNGHLNYFWRNPPKKRCASVRADVLVETVPLKAEVSVSGTANPDCILRIVKTDFKFSEDPEDLRDDTPEMIEYAQDALQKFKDIKVRGSLTLDKIDLTWNLRKTVNLINTQQSSWETLNAKVVGVNFNFDENTTTLEITNEFLK